MMQTTTRQVRRYNTDENDVETVTLVDELVYRTPCGSEHSAEYTTPDLLKSQHASCRACAIIEGRSKRSVLTQDEVQTLFKLGIDEKRSGSDNYSSSSGILSHYGTIEGIRTHAGKVIGNTQCWSAGFASCSLHGADYRLPLSTLRALEANRWSSTCLRDIEVLDELDGDTLFRYMGRFFIFGRDERAEFLVELPGPVTDVLGGLVSLKPLAVQLAVYNGLNVKRQGDLFFIPKDAPTDDEMTDVPQRAHFKENAVTRFERRLVRPKILETTHTAGELVKTERGLFVRGTIMHQPEFRRAEHAPLKLGNEWHVVIKNAAVASWQVPRRGGRAGVD